MSDPVNFNSNELSLPPSIITRVDVSRLVSEVEQLDSYMIAADARAKSGMPSTGESVQSEQLADFLAVNNIEIGDASNRSELIKQLRRLKSTVPWVHMTFAVPADNESLREIVAWLRESVHPQSVIMVGMQPSLVGGVYVRTPNQVHDMSLRAQLAGRRDIITREVEALSGGN